MKLTVGSIVHGYAGGYLDDSWEDRIVIGAGIHEEVRWFVFAWVSDPSRTYLISGEEEIQNVEQVEQEARDRYRP